MANAVKIGARATQRAADAGAHTAAKNKAAAERVQCTAAAAAGAAAAAAGIFIMVAAVIAGAAANRAAKQSERATTASCSVPSLPLCVTAILTRRIGDSRSRRSQTIRLGTVQNHERERTLRLGVTARRRALQPAGGDPIRRARVRIITAGSAISASTTAATANATATGNGTNDTGTPSSAAAAAASKLTLRETREAVRAVRAAVRSVGAATQPRESGAQVGRAPDARLETL